MWHIAAFSCCSCHCLQRDTWNSFWCIAANIVYETVSGVLQQTLVIAHDMLLIGIVDSELISRLGEFSLSLLQRGTSLHYIISVVGRRQCFYFSPFVFVFLSIWKISWNLGEILVNFWRVGVWAKWYFGCDADLVWDTEKNRLMSNWVVGIERCMSSLGGLCSDESLLALLLPLMYQMIDSSRIHGFSGNVAEDEGVSCHSSQLPRLLGVVINIITKRSTTDQVLEMCSLAETVTTVHSILLSLPYEGCAESVSLYSFTNININGFWWEEFKTQSSALLKSCPNGTIEIGSISVETSTLCVLFSWVSFIITAGRK